MSRGSAVRLDRQVPAWAAMLLARLGQDRPPVVTRDDLTEYLAEAGVERDLDHAIRSLVALDWLTGTHVQSVWAFLAHGETTTGDPYIDLRAWLAKEPAIELALAGEAAAFHLGYLDRRFDGPIALWLAEGRRPPPGVRPLVSLVRLRFRPGVDVGPSWELLRRRGLDVNVWATGLPAFGPEALLVQLAVRPGSFGPWADLAAHASGLTGDCDVDRVRDLLDGQSGSSWQRAAYLLHAGGAEESAIEVLSGRPKGKLSHVTMGESDEGVYVAQFGVTDRLFAPLLAQAGKA